MRVRVRLGQISVSYLRRRRDEIRYGMDDDSGEASGRDPEEGRGQSIESHDNDYSSKDTRCWGSNTRLGLQGGTGKRASGGICAEARTDGVCNTNGNEFLVGIDFVIVQTSKRYSPSQPESLRQNRDLTFSDSDVFKEENDGCYRELRCQS